jgi:hypothetical protein
VQEPELNEPEIGKPVYRLIIGSIARNQSLSDFRTCKKKSEGFPLACSKRDAGIEIDKQYLERKYPSCSQKAITPFLTSVVAP